MDHRERITTAVAAPHLARPVGSAVVGGGVAAGNGAHRMLQSTGSLSRGSTLERPTAARSVLINQQHQHSPNTVHHHNPHLITTTVEVEHPRPSAKRSNGQATGPATTTTASPTTNTYQANPANQILLPKTIVIIRNDHHGFGFTLRHFIVYPPAPGSHGHHEDFPQSLMGGNFQLTEPMDTVFVKEVRPKGPAHVAGLKTGDRLLTVNGLSVNGMQYAHVVSTIQQVPTVLTLQVVPKECDILQTCFSAHNPETNQRPRQSLEAALANNSPSFAGHPQQQLQPVMPMVAPYPHIALQSPNVAAAAAAAGVQLHSPGKRRESLVSLASSTHDSNMKEIEESNAAIAMLRLKKNIEQKEEFMRRPQNHHHHLQNHHQQQPGQSQPGWRAVLATDLNGQAMAREFYSRPKKLQKPVWPPSLEEQQQMRKNLPPDQNQFVPIQKPSSNSTHQQQLQQNKLMKSKCREQFFNMVQQQQEGSAAFDEISVASPKSDSEFPIPSNGLHIVSEKTKLFESGRPLSPDGSCVDRTLLYKSELSRLNQKVAVPNVALRKKEYEQIHEHSDYSRLSTTDTETIVSETGSGGGFRQRTQSPPPVPPARKATTIEVPEDSLHNSQSVLVVRREPRPGASLTTEGGGLGGVGEDDRRMRRISYLRATANDTNLEMNHHPHNNNNNSLMSGGAVGLAHSSSPASGSATTLSAAEYAENDRVLAMNVISDNRDKRRHGRQLGGAGSDEGPAEAMAENGSGTASATIGDYNDEEMALLLRSHNKDKKRMSSASILALHEGPMQIKITLIDGKRSHDRSWKNVWAELKANKLNLTVQREGKANQSLGGIDLNNFQVMDAMDYTKKKHVFKLLSRPPQHHSTIGHTEILIQSENESQMNVWRDLLQAVCDPNSLLKRDCVVSDGGNQVAEPQSVASSKVVDATSPTATQNDDLKTSTITPPTSGTQSRKYYLGSRSPSGQSPVTKSRKTPQQLNISIGGAPLEKSTTTKDGGSDKEAGSPKPRAWKLLVTKQLRKIQGSGHGSTQVSFPEGGSVGVPIQFCVPSADNEFVPLLVARCTGIVEEKGMDIVGIYRIPGNTANITALTEQVNRGFDETTLADHRWDDVNVVSSLLKAFLRQLPEPLIPDDMYPSFINADKKRGELRLRELKGNLDLLPVHNYHTMRHLMRHLHRISENCAVNLMDPKNIAIVFGPSVVRMSKQTLELAVKDMKHQCCIVEALVSQYQFFFENGPMPVISELSSPTSDSVSSVPSTNLLLDNVAKLEPMGERNVSSSIVGSIVQAANRKLRKSSNRKTILSSGGTPDNLSLDSSTSTESKDVGAIYSAVESKDGDRLKGLTQATEEDHTDGLLNENGSMSLKTVTITLDNKLRTLRSSLDENTTDGDEEEEDDDNETESINSAKRRSAGESLMDRRMRDEHQSLSIKLNNKRKMKHFTKNQPLTVFDDNIPYADESPERSMTLIPILPAVTTTMTATPGGARLSTRQNSFKSVVSSAGDLSVIPTTTTMTMAAPVAATVAVTPAGSTLNKYSKAMSQQRSAAADAKEESSHNNSDQGVDGLSTTSSDDTDTSTTSSVQMTVDPDMLRKMNRILTNLERNTTKMNRSLSLNYKNVQKGGDCCCHVNHRLMNRGGGGGGPGMATAAAAATAVTATVGGLTKDEKTDKNNMKKRHSQEKVAGGGGTGGGGVVSRRYGNRSIRRRHTVGGTHDYSPRGGGGGENYRTPCHYYVMSRSSSPE